MILHLESKLVIRDFLYIGAYSMFHVSSSKSAFVFLLSIFNQDEVSGMVLTESADLLEGLSTVRSYFLI